MIIVYNDMCHAEKKKKKKGISTFDGVVFSNLRICITKLEK